MAPSSNIVTATLLSPPVTIDPIVPVRVDIEIEWSSPPRLGFQSFPHRETVQCWRSMADLALTFVVGDVIQMRLDRFGWDENWYPPGTQYAKKTEMGNVFLVNGNPPVIPIVERPKKSRFLEYSDGIILPMIRPRR
jgi:hypothetical protein